MCFSRSSYSSPVTPPIALAYLSAALKSNGYDPICIDAVGEDISQLVINEDLNCFQRGISIDEIIVKIPQDTIFVGVSCMFSQEWLMTQSLLKKIKLSYPDITLIIGGEHATALPEYLLENCQEIDVIALGEGDQVIVDIVKKFKAYPETIPGIVYRNSDKIIKTLDRPRVKMLNELPFPDWEKIPIAKYHDSEACNGVYGGITMPILATRGCPYQCTFCSNPKMWGKNYYTRDPESVIKEIKLYVNKYNATAIEFYDLTAIIKKSWILDFCRLYKEQCLKVSWSLPSGTRSESLDEETLRELSETNCTYLVYAAESGSVETLKKIKKKIKLKDFIRSLRTAKHFGLTLRCNLMIGIPNEKRLDVLRTLFFQWRLAILGVDDLPLYMFSPYPGSELFKELVENEEVQQLDETYFKSLLQQIDFFKCQSYNKNISGWELASYRIIGMGTAYFLGYLCHPLRIIRSIRNIFFLKRSHTVFEQRIIELIRSRRQYLDAI